jgi:hypothetical protein
MHSLTLALDGGEGTFLFAVSVDLKCVRIQAHYSVPVPHTQFQLYFCKRIFCTGTWEKMCEQNGMEENIFYLPVAQKVRKIDNIMHSLLKMCM